MAIAFGAADDSKLFGIDPELKQNLDNLPPVPADVPAGLSPAAVAWGVAATISGAACAYHGYKRNQSVPWALVWAFAGWLAFPVTPAIAVAQGFGKRPQRSNPRRPRRKNPGKKPKKPRLAIQRLRGPEGWERYFVSERRGARWWPVSHHETLEAARRDLAERGG